MPYSLDRNRPKASRPAQPRAAKSRSAINRMNLHGGLLLGGGEARPYREFDQVSAVVYIQLLHEAGAVAHHRLHAQAQQFADLPVAAAPGQQLEHLLLAGADLVPPALLLRLAGLAQVAVYHRAGGRG